MSQLQIFDTMEQNSPEWFAARLGIPTASCFSMILAKGEGKTRASYMRKLAAEIYTGERGEEFQRMEFDRGHAMEDEARSFYSLMTDEEPRRVGFIRNGDKGCSPDAMIGDNGLLEIKTQRADLLIETLRKNEFPPEHRAQTQGALWVAEREWIDLIVYWPKMPRFIKRAYRDEGYILQLSAAVKLFNEELAEMVEGLRKIGGQA